MEIMADEKLAKRSDARECDGRTALRELWKEWEENGEQLQEIEGVGV